MDGLLDASVAIDIYRGYPPAVAWMNAHTSLQIGITPLTWMEVVAGATSKVRLQRVKKFLDLFPLVTMEIIDIDWAMQQLEAYRLSHGVDIPDCLIAAPSHRLKITLYTRNLKHFAPLLGHLAQEPYA